MSNTALPLIDLFAETAKDKSAREVLFSYPRNPYGAGYLIDIHEGASGERLLPNFEEPTQQLTQSTIVRHDLLHWPRGPMVAGVGWLGCDFFPRNAQLGLPFCFYDEDAISAQEFIEVSNEWLNPISVAQGAPMPAKLDVRVAQSAAHGMRAKQVLPGATIELLHLHPREERCTFRLPARSPRMAFRLPNAKAAEVPGQIRTLYIEPDEDRVTVVWVAEARPSLPLMPDAHARIEHGVIWDDA